MLVISPRASQHFGFEDELQHLVGYRCSASSNAIDCCSRILGSGMYYSVAIYSLQFNLPTFQGSHVIAMMMLIFAPGWWTEHFKPVINPMPLADIRNPPNLDPPPLFGPAVKRGRGDQLQSDTDESEVMFCSLFMCVSPPSVIILSGRIIVILPLFYSLTMKT